MPITCKLWLLCLCFTASSTSVTAQITLDSCYSAAEKHYPTAKHYNLIEQSLYYTLENASRSWWPQVQFSAKAQLQSDVTKLPFNISRPGMGEAESLKLSKDQYAATVSLRQTIYDGGNTRAAKKTAEAHAETQRLQTESEIYQLRQRVNDLYFGILLTDEQLRINALHQDNLQLGIERIKSLIQGGLAHEADLDIIKVEQLKALQAADNYQAVRTAYMAMLAQLTGLNLSPNTPMKIPALPPESGQYGLLGENRPETKMFAAKINEFYWQKNKVIARLRPQLELFAQGGYGRPGLNMLKNEMKPYGMAGVNLTWNFAALYTRKANCSLIYLQVQNVEVEQDIFNHNLRIEAAQRQTELTRYKNLLAHDDQIIALRQNIRRTTEAKLAGGTLTTNDLVRETNAEKQARLDRALHQMHLLLAAYNLKITWGE